MLRRSIARRPLLVMVIWTLVIWVSRVRNIWADDELSAGGQVARTVVALLFVGLALAALRWREVVMPFCVWTIGYWAVRSVQIIAKDHELGFTVVHTVLALISIGLAVWVGVACQRYGSAGHRHRETVVTSGPGPL
jgi:hypothetical protein